jgi:ATP-dependent DNA helicase RecQ
VSSEWDEIRRQVLRRDGHRCVDCSADLKVDGAHVHHLLPRAAGGSDEPANLVSLCQMCHAAVHPHLGVGLAFRPGQIDVVEAALLGRSLLLVSPTGSGKSIAFQVPAVLTPGLCIVVSPLKALCRIRSRACSGAAFRRRS